jgi:RNA polymerase sigma factor (sigma-70 family)
MAATETSTRANASLDDLYRHHVGEVYRYTYAVLGNHADAEDVTQTTFVNALRALERGESPRNPSGWLIAIAQNVVRQRWRQAASRPAEVELVQDVPDTPEEPDVELDELVRALQRIPPTQREALVLRELEGRSYNEIAELLGLTTSALETLLFRARRSLAEELENLVTCQNAELAMSKQLDGRLGRKERRRLEEHLAECPDCARLAETQKRQRKAFKGLAVLPVPIGLALFKGAPSASAAASLPTIGLGAAGSGTASTAGTAGATGTGAGAATATTGAAAAGSLVAAAAKIAAVIVAATIVTGLAYKGIQAVVDDSAPSVVVKADPGTVVGLTPAPKPAASLGPAPAPGATAAAGTVASAHRAKTPVADDAEVAASAGTHRAGGAPARHDPSAGTAAAGPATGADGRAGTPAEPATPVSGAPSTTAPVPKQPRPPRAAPTTPGPAPAPAPPASSPSPIPPVGGVDATTTTPQPSPGAVSPAPGLTPADPTPAPAGEPGPGGGSTESPGCPADGSGPGNGVGCGIGNANGQDKGKGAH